MDATCESVPDDFNVEVISAAKKQIVLAVTTTCNPHTVLSVIEVGVLQGQAPLAASHLVHSEATDDGSPVFLFVIRGPLNRLPFCPSFGRGLFRFGVLAAIAEHSSRKQTWLQWKFASTTWASASHMRPGKYAKIRFLQKCVFRAIWEIETLTCNSDSWIPTCSFISSLGT